MIPASAINWPHPLVKQAWEDGISYPSGSTEPWVQQAVAALLVASGQTSVLELGSYLGLTTAWLTCALQRMGGGGLVTIEVDGERADQTATLLTHIATPDVKTLCLTISSIDYLAGVPLLQPGFAWVDDDHTPAHVDEELTLLRPLMKPGGLICMHDVHGPLGLAAVCERHGGYVLRFPVLGPAGGLGVIQV